MLRGAPEAALARREPAYRFARRPGRRVPITIHAKLLAAFLTMVVLLNTLGAVGLQALSGVKHRTEELVQLQRKIAIN